MEQARTLTIDGTSYDIGQFSQGVQQAVMIHNKFSAQLQDQQLEVLKTNAALREVAAQIGEAVKAELEQKRAEAAGETPPLANGHDTDA